MGDSIAPEITIDDTKDPGTSRVGLAMLPISPQTNQAISIQSNIALNISLRSKNRPPSPPSEPHVCPPGTSPVDFYFPKKSRNQAPSIELDYNKSISVRYSPVNPSVGGVKANSVDSVAFWRQSPPPKYSAPDTHKEPRITPETSSTAAYGKYYPAKFRNFAPNIVIKKPAGSWDKSGFVQVSSAYIPYNEEIARNVKLPHGAEKSNELNVAACATIENYYGGEKMYKAPYIVIDNGAPKVEFGMDVVPEPLSEAANILKAAGK